MPNTTPKTMPKEPTPEQMAQGMLRLVLASPTPHLEVRPFVRTIMRERSVEYVQEMLKIAYPLLIDNNQKRLAEYLKELFGYGPYKDCFYEIEAEPEPEEEPQPEKKMEAEPVQMEEKPAGEESSSKGLKIWIMDIVKYCEEECYTYTDVKAIYDMMLELQYGNTAPDWIEGKARLKRCLKKFRQGVVINAGEGAEVNLEKHVANEVKNVRPGATGINIQK